MTVEIPGYKIVRVLGTGGMATVYLAVQEIFEREVALKVMSPGLADDPQFGQRFVREARIVSQFTHPNIVTVYDVGVHNSLYYLSMAYVDGSDLQQAQPDLSLREKVQVIRDLAQALELTGSKGYVHRDIKPENILLERVSRRAVLTDFGIARAAETDLCFTRTGMALGTPHYMSPEQAKGQTVDPRADLYSLGIVFYFLLTGVLPFHADSAVAIGIKHVTEPVPQLPAPLASLQPLLDKLLAKAPEQRFQSAGQLLAQLDRVNLERLEKRLRHAPLNKTSTPDAGDLTQVHATTVCPESSSTPARTWRLGASMGWAGGTVLAVLVLGWLWPFGASEPEGALDPALPAAVLGTAEWDLNKDSAAAEPDAVPPTPQHTAPNDADAYQVLGRFDILGRLSRRVQDAGHSLGKSNARLTEEASAQRVRLQADPNDRKAQAAIQDLGLIELYEAREKFNLGQFDAAQQQFDRFQALFPEMALEEQQALQARMQKTAELKSYLQRAEQALEEDRLTQPATHSALYFYDQALALDERLLVARLGRERISDALTERAQALFEAGEWQRAEADLKHALDIMPNNPSAQELLGQLRRVSAQQDDLEPLLELARKHLTAGKLYSPEGSNAYLYFQRALALAPEHDQVRQGLQDVHKALERLVLAQVGDGDYDGARQSLRAAEQVRRGDGQLQLLMRSVEETIDAQRTAQAPRVVYLTVDGRPLSRPERAQSHTIRAEHTLYGAFHFANFKETPRVLQAQLFEQEGRRPILDTPVAISDTSGETTFRMDRSQGGFPPGRYNLQIKLDDQVLTSVAFAVARP